MLGMLNKGGGQNMPQGMGQNQNLAALFGSNQAAAPVGAQSQLPQIMAPQTPNIGMPPSPRQMPMHQSAAAPLLPWSPILINGQYKPAYKTSAVQQTGRGSAGRAEYLSNPLYRGGGR